MSLINDALKKAARERAEEQGEIAPRPGGGRRNSGRGGPMQKQTLILIGAAAIVLIVVSVVLTGMFMTGKPEAKPATAASPTPTTIAEAAAKIIIEAPAVAVAVPTATPAPTVAVLKPTPTPVPVVIQTPEAATPATPSAAAAKVADTSQGHMDEMQAIVDGFHISGVRTAGSESKALVDGHIYKLNDIVDKKSGLRLVKVDVDHLTFTDRDGNTFVRTF
jgi:amino acid permease